MQRNSKCTVCTRARLILCLGMIGDEVAVPTRIPTVRRETRHSLESTSNLDLKVVFGHNRLSAVGRGRSHCLVILPVVVFLPVVFSHSLTRDRVERARERRQDPVEHGGHADQVALIYDSPVTSSVEIEPLCICQ
jgi:hypothetical protein